MATLDTSIVPFTAVVPVATAPSGGGGGEGAADSGANAPPTTLFLAPPPPVITPGGPFTRIALDPLVLLDIDRFIGAFEVDNLRSLASFRTLAQEFCIGDPHLTARAGRRQPPPRETETCGVPTARGRRSALTAVACRA